MQNNERLKIREKEKKFTSKEIHSDARLAIREKIFRMFSHFHDKATLKK